MANDAPEAGVESPRHGSTDSNLAMIAGRILGWVAAVALPVLGTVVVLTRAWVFSFNPGMQIDAMHLGDEPVPFVHDSGLLTVEAGALPEAASAVVLSLRARGVPDPDFGYLDGAVDWRRRPATNLIKYLGTEASLFHRNYVALT